MSRRSGTKTCGADPHASSTNAFPCGQEAVRRALERAERITDARLLVSLWGGGRRHRFF